MAKRPEVAVLAITVENGKALLVQRKNPPDAGLWGFPGGRVEFGETLQQAAERELHEETGVTATAGAVLGHLENIKEGFHYLLFGVLCSNATGTPLADDDALQAEWVDIAEIEAGERDLSQHVAETCRAAEKLLGGSET